VLTDKKAILAATIATHRNKIIRDIIETRCPNCDLTFSDWDACFAVKHEGSYVVNGQEKTVGCMKYFCGWCLEKFDNNSECHKHVKICPDGTV